MTHVQFYLPTKPYSVVDAINRVAAATGSVGYARGSANANYNGHYINLSWNDYRGYYVAEHYWGERVVHARSADPVAAVRAAVCEYQAQGRGASLHASVRSEHADAVRALDLLIEGTEPSDYGPWYTWRHKLVGDAMSWERHFPGEGQAALLCAADEADYDYLRSSKGAQELRSRKPTVEALQSPVLK